MGIDSCFVMNVNYVGVFAKVKCWNCIVIKQDEVTLVRRMNLNEKNQVAKKQRYHRVTLREKKQQENDEISRSKRRRPP